MNYELLVSEHNLDNTFKDFGGRNFIKVDPLKRSEMISEFMNKDEPINYVTRENMNQSLGLVVIKPEAQPIKKELIETIQRTTDVDLIEVNDTRYTPTLYRKVYGYKSFFSPSVELGVVFPPLLFSGCSGIITGIAFKHPDNNNSTEDRQNFYKKSIVGSGPEPKPNTLRLQIRTTLNDLGFGLIDTPFAKSFETVGISISL